MGTKTKKVLSRTFLQKTTDFSDKFEKVGEEFEEAHIPKSFDFMKEETKETEDAYNALRAEDRAEEDTSISKNAEEVFDGYLDTAFVALAGAYKFLRLRGISHQEATNRVEIGMHRVCDANNAKAQPDGSVARNEVGKVQKPEGWTPPQFADLLGPMNADVNDQGAA